jgi:uncharacterized protein (TIGR02265 family)
VTRAIVIGDPTSFDRVGAILADQSDLALVCCGSWAEAARHAELDYVALDARSAEAAVSAAALAELSRASGVERVIDPALLASLTVLHEDDLAFQRAADLMARAFGSAGAAITIESPRIFALGGGHPKSNAATIGERLRQATSVGTLVAPALVVADSGFESYSAVPIPGLGGGHAGTIAIVDVGPRAPEPGVRRALEAVAIRLGEEIRWRSAHGRIISELDAARANDGLDPLMGIWSRTAFMRLVDGLMGYARRHDLPVTLGVIDVVGMAAINERAGYDLGDGVLRHLAEVARYVMRGEDIIGRHGGDSLVLGFIGTSTERAAIAVERLQNALAGDPIVDGEGHSIEIVTAAGLAVIHDGDDAERAAGRANETARQALHEGRTLLTATHVSQKSGGESALGLPMPHAGTTVGGLYRVTHEVGSGGGGSVYRGVDLGLRRPVAIKMLRPDLARNAAALERFREEAATLAALSHPNLVQIYAAGVDGGVPYFVMEMVEGETVSQAIERCIRERHTLPLRQVRSIVEQVAGALDALHSRGIVHRDVKPANILVDPFRRRTVLVDVGVARRHGDRQEVAGTPVYLPPEGFYAVEPQPSFDLFSFAVTVFEMLTLELPWPAEETIAQTELTRRTVAPRPLSECRPDLAPLDAVFARGLEVEPELRWSSIAEFAAAIVAGLDEVVAAEASPPSLTGVSFDSSPAPSSQEQVTRGVVFRSLARVVGARAANRWRVELGRSRPDLAALLSSASEPLAWHPTKRLVELLDGAPDPGGATSLAGELGRATVRATFRRFFPASALTLTPSSTLEALDVIWKQYQSWGRTEVAHGGDERAVVRLCQVPDDALLHAFARGMLEQLVTLSGGREVSVSDRADDECWAFELSWAAPERIDGVMLSTHAAESGSVPNLDS